MSVPAETFFGLKPIESFRDEQGLTYVHIILSTGAPAMQLTTTPQQR